MENSIDLANVKQIVSDILAQHNINDVAFVGCGASSSELYPGFYFLKDAAKKVRAFHYTAAEFNNDTPQWLGENSVVIAASLGGGTPETVEAIDVAKAAGATVISVTHVADSALTQHADYVIVHGFEKNYAAKLEKMGYVMALAVELCNQIEGYKHYDQMVEGFNNIFDLGERAANQAKGLAAQFGKDFKDDEVIYYMSSGASMQVAYSSSICLMMEMQWIHSGNFHAGEFFHGPFEIVDKDVPFVLMMNEGKTRAIDSRALDFLNRFGAKVAVVDTKDYGLSSEVSSEVVTYFNPLVHTAVFRTYAEAIAQERQHPLTLRRYMWKIEY
ncbi:SIS domain-containing protein [Atopobium fossor]|uniref:SIS domain-containing protein n=1 Tax=Atopobium fossor TaxID=39487 RepID=UPI0004062BC4|nr:SIS domain-containing protein [Atopobium fossor]